MITIPIPLALLALGAVALLSSFVTIAAMALGDAAKRADQRMYAGADALDSMDEEGA